MFNDLIQELEEEGTDPFAYADDLAINGFKFTKMKKAINQIEKWVTENKMKINKKKSGIIFH